jgi:putative nucleotidyltransferase with HDIG domain
MIWRNTFLRSRVARRIFLLFVSCALLPIAILAVVSFYQVSAQLHRESDEQLAQINKSVAMAIYQRLQMASAEMQVLTLKPGWSRSGPDNSLGEYFSGVTLFDETENVIANWGDLASFPRVAQKEKLHLLAGNPLISVHRCSLPSNSCVAVVRTMSIGYGATGTLVGEINPDYLWDKEKLPGGFEACALSASGSILSCSDSAQAASLAVIAKEKGAFSGFFQWKNRGTVYEAAYRMLLLKPEFLTDSWTVSLSQKQTDILAPMHHFRQTFPWVILLALWIVTLFSSIQIRRTLVPLEKLEAGAREIGAQHFDRRVDIHSRDEFEAVASSFNSMATQLGRQFHALRAINAIDQAIFASLDREAIADAVLDHMPYLLPCHGFAIAVFGQASSSGWARLKNVQTGETRAIPLPSPSDFDLRQLEKTPRVLMAREGQPVPNFVLPLREAQWTSFLILPIVIDKAVFAALICAHSGDLQISEDDIKQARQVADQLAVAFANVQLIKALEQLHWGTLTALARAIDAKSEWTAGHSERVTALALKIGRAMGLSAKDLQIMHRGGLLHDIGKIGTPPAVLDKPGKLEPEETRVMREHVRIGLRILEPIPGFHEALSIVAQHHEWFDGSGYPDGVAGENISLHARIFAVADCYDAMTSDRPYRKGLPREKTLEIIHQQAGKQFDPSIVEVFAQMCAEEQVSARHQSSRAAAASQSG